MTAEVIAKLEEIGERTPEWHALRRSGLGGSDAPVVAGLSPWRSPYDLWVEKTGPGDEAEAEEAEYMRWGHLLEAPIAAEFSLRSGLSAEALPVVLRSVEHPFMLANVDRVVVTYETGIPRVLGPLEIKTTRYETAWPFAEDGTVEVPLHVLAQDCHYLAVGGWDTVWNAVLIGGQELRIAEVHRTDDLIADLVALEAEFWDKVARRVPPPLDGSSATRRALARHFKASEGTTVALKREPASFLLGERQRLLSEIAERTAVVAEIENELCAMLGEAETGTLEDEVAVTWKAITRRTITAKALRAAHPSIAQEFERQSTYRRFGVGKAWRPVKDGGSDDPE